MKQTVNMKT